mgnify:CR=1 FL=1
MTTIVEDVEQQKVRKEPVKKGCPYWMGLIPCTLLLVADGLPPESRMVLPHIRLRLRWLVLGMVALLDCLSHCDLRFVRIL